MTEPNHEKFADLFTRLEKATAALEDIVQRNDTGSVLEVPAAPAAPSRALSELDASTASLAAEEETPSIKAFGEFLELYVDPFTSLSTEINAVVGEQARSLAGSFKEQFDFIKAAAKSKKPDFTKPESAEFLAPLQEQIGAINKFKDDNRRSDFYSYLTAIAEGTSVLSWFLVPAPVSYIPEIKDSATFWTNKVLKEFRESEPKAAEWVKQYLGIFEGLKLYVKQYHTTGLTYNEKGQDLATTLKAQTQGASSQAPPPPPPAPVAAPAASGGAPPPPPPPPPPPADIFEDSKPSTAAPPSGGLDAMFSELNQGADITKGLKKVDRSQMTHKNPELRQSSLVRSGSTNSQSSAGSGKKSPPVPKKPNNLSLKPKPEPVIELQDYSKWIIKNVEGKHDIVIEGDISQSVFIGNCSEITVQIKGKVNAVSLSSTFKTAIVVDSLVSGVDIVNSKKFGIQVVERVPQISIDKSDEGQIYLSKTSLETEIYSSSTTSLNINVPDDDGDFKEVSAPEQFKHTFDSTGKISSTIVEHAG